MKYETIRNKARFFVQNHMHALWKIKDKSNETKMIKRYNVRKSMTIDEAKNVVTEQYKYYHGKTPNILEPRRYTEKIQYRKLYGYTELMRDLSDKVLVRNWVKERIGDEYLVPCLGVYDSFDEIDFSVLPNKFVLKTNHSSGWNAIIKDKNKIKHEELKHKFDLWLSMDYAYVTGFEMQYHGIAPKIICEEFMADSSGELTDYKFLCFNGEVRYCWVDIGRYKDHRRNVYDTSWILQPWTQCHKQSEKPIEKPQNYEKMVEIANALCKGLDHVRVDLYNVDGRIYFGEMTFTNGSGFEPIIPDEYDYKLGEMWK